MTVTVFVGCVLPHALSAHAVRARIAAEAATKRTRISAQPVAATGVAPRAAKAVAAAAATAREVRERVTARDGGC
jgi:hypothetical protein